MRNTLALYGATIKLVLAWAVCGGLILYVTR